MKREATALPQSLAPREAGGARFHVFPHGRMCSLRRAMLLWLVPMFLIVGIASAGFSYWSYSRMVGEFMDDQMEQMGQAVALQADQHLMPPAPTQDRVNDWGAYVVQVWGPDRQLRVSSWPGLHGTPQPGPGFDTAVIDGRTWRVYTSQPGTQGRTVQVYQSGKFRARLAAERAGAALLPVLILLPLAILILWGLSGAMSRAVQDISRSASRQDENSITELPLDRVPQELKPLVLSFNSLLTRLRDAFAVQRRLVQDAAHELRTPITAVALQLENVRRDLPSGACAESFSQLQAGVSRAQRTVDQLLKLSRQEATSPDTTTQVDVQAQLRESIGALIALADQRRIDLGFVSETGALPAVMLRCAAADFRSVVDNLIENALRYAPEGGVVDVHLRVEGDRPVVEVVDNGPGIAPDMIDRVFDRFFRVPGSAMGGSGLGLAIARSAAQRCGLRISLRNRTDGPGLVARVEFA